MDDIGTRNILLNGDIGEDTVAPIIERILEIDEFDNYWESCVIDYEREPIKLFINTFGGSGHDMLALISVMKMTETPIATIVLGKAMSAGFIIAMCGDRRYCNKYSQYMVHGGKTGGYGRSSDIRDIADSLDQQDEHVRELIQLHTEFPIESYDEICRKAKDFYFGADLALKYKFVDEVIG